MRTRSSSISTAAGCRSMRKPRRWEMTCISIMQGIPVRNPRGSAAEMGAAPSVTGRFLPFPTARQIFTSAQRSFPIPTETENGISSVITDTTNSACLWIRRCNMRGLPTPSLLRDGRPGDSVLPFLRIPYSLTITQESLKKQCWQTAHCFTMMRSEKPHLRYGVHHQNHKVLAQR